MGEITDLIDKAKRYYGFTPSEIRGLIATVFVIAFIISFKEWGTGNVVDISSGILNLIIAILITAISLFIHESAHRMSSLYVGLRAEYKPWTFGLIFGLIIAFLSNGKIWILLPGGFVVHHLPGHRIGWWRYDIAYVTLGMLALWGTLTTLFFALLLKVLNNLVSNPIFEKAILLNIALVIYTMLPLPPLNGSKLFYGSRMIYVFSSLFVVATSILLIIDINPWLSVVSAFIVSIIGWVLYYYYVERNVWQGPFGGMKG